MIGVSLFLPHVSQARGRISLFGQCRACRDRPQIYNSVRKVRSIALPTTGSCLDCLFLRDDESKSSIRLGAVWHLALFSLDFAVRKFDQRTFFALSPFSPGIVV